MSTRHTSYIKKIVAFAMMLSISAIATSGEKEAAAALQKKDYSTAFNDYMPIAEAGDGDVSCIYPRIKPVVDQKASEAK